MKRYLPIGSVVLLNESSKRVMIIGLKQKQADSDKIWDYSACLYPEGVINPDKLYLFDEEQVHKLYFIGFQDGEALSFLEKLRNSETE